jgi:CBS domain containing-hemolysin-like protein
MDEFLPLLLAVFFTLSVSAFCSLLEAMILSTTTADIESLKQRSARLGGLLEQFREEIEETSSAILTLNTVANTAGASVSGALAIQALGEGKVVYFSGALVLAILIFSEILPKNIGVLYRSSLLPYMVSPLRGVRILTKPVSALARKLVQWVTSRVKKVEEDDVGGEEIKLLAERSAEEGNLSLAESTIITNALSLDEVRVHEIMTPRTVVTAYEKSDTVASVLADGANIPFARLPVFEETIDTIVGLVRRRDILHAKAEQKDATTMAELMHEVTILPDTASGSRALQQLIKAHQQQAVAVDEFGSVSGVITMEDLMEYILGQEIFERDDPAVDMRELARRRERVRARKRARSEGSRASS